MCDIVKKLVEEDEEEVETSALLRAGIPHQPPPPHSTILQFDLGGKDTIANSATKGKSCTSSDDWKCSSSETSLSVMDLMVYVSLSYNPDVCNL